MKAKVCISVFIFLAVFFIPNAYVISQTLPPISELGPSRKSIIQKSLLDLHDSYLSEGLSKSRMLAKRVGIKSVGEKVRVDIDFYGEKPSIEYLAEFGIEKDDSFYEYGSHIQMAVPIRNIRLLENLPSVASVKLPPKGHPDIVSQGVEVIGASEYHEKGYNGEGVKIAIIDGGFSGYSSLLGYELPNAVITKSFYGSVSGYGDITGEGEDHGTACAEIIYDIAPEATFYLINFETLAELNAAVDYAISQNVDIVSHSMGWFNTSNYDGTGNVCSLVDKARQKDILWVNSAGNSANKHYEGYFSDPDDDRWHNFSGVGEVIEIEADTGDMMDVYLSWNAWPRTSKDYDLYLWKKSSSGEFEKLESSENAQIGYQEPTESIHYEATYTGTYYVTVWKKADSGNAKIEIFSSTHEFTRYSVPESSIPDPACSENALAVGATRWYNDSLEDFSSRGPTNDDRIKPDLVAPDGVSTFTYSSFWGTSASCPHVAGAAALTLELNPTWNPAEIENFLFANARDLGSLGNDNLYGWGRISLPEPPSEPNLRPHKLAEWDYELVPSSVKGTNTVDQLIGGEVTYFDLAVLNDSEADMDSTQIIIEVHIYIDGSLRKELRTKGLLAGWYVYWTDLPMIVDPGTYLVRFEIDPLNKINESNEGDNVWERSFTWIKPYFSLISPSDNSEVGARPTLRWESALDATTVIYTLEYSLDGTFTFVARVDSIYQNSYTFQKDLKNDQIYYWRVWARDQSGVSIVSSETWRFVVNSSNLPPSPPVLLIPEENAELRPWGYFVWAEPDDPDPGDSLSYTLEISKQMETTAIASISDVRSNVLAKLAGSGKSIAVRLDQIPGWVSLQDDSTYFWRVKTIDNHGAQSQFVGRAFFYNKENSTPLKVEGGFWPTGGAIVNNLTPRITWGMASDPDLSDPSNSLRYLLQLNDSQDFETDCRYSYETEPGDTSFTSSEPLSGSHEWFYQVRAIDDEGAESPWSDVQFFSVTVIGIKGDVNGDGNVNSGDAILVLRISVGLLTPTANQWWAADVNEDGLINSGDAILILRKAVGLPSFKRIPLAKVLTGVEVSVSDMIGYPGEKSVVWISVSDATGIAGGDLTLTYDPNILTAEEVKGTALAVGLLVVSNVSTPGEVKISLAGAVGLSVGSGSLIEVTFDVREDAEAGRTSPLRLTEVTLRDEAGNPLSLGAVSEGTFTVGGVSVEETEAMGQPHAFALFQNVPNPFNPITTIRYQLPEPGYVKLAIYDLLGQGVRVLVSEMHPTGWYCVNWDGRDETGRLVSSGVYLYSMEAGSFTETRKALLLR